MELFLGLLSFLSLVAFLYSIFALIFPKKATIVNTRPKAFGLLVASLVLSYFVGVNTPHNSKAGVDSTNRTNLSPRPATTVATATVSASPSEEQAQANTDALIAAAIKGDKAEAVRLEKAFQDNTAPFAGIPPAPINAWCFDKTDQDCPENRYQFMKQWPMAWKGDYQSQRNIAYMLSSQSPGVLFGKQVQGCAWRIVILVSGHTEFDGTDTSNFNVDCGDLKEAEFSAAKSVASTIFTRIKGKKLPEVPKPVH